MNTFWKQPLLDTASQMLMKRFLFEMYRMIAVTNIWPKLLIFWNMNNFVSIPLAFVRVVSVTHKICRTQISCNKGNGTGFWFIHYRLMTANFGVIWTRTGLCVQCALHIVWNPTCENDCYHTKNTGIDRAILIAALISKIRQIHAKERVKNV